MRNILSRNKRLAPTLAALIILFAGLIARHNMVASVSTDKPWERWSADSTEYGYVAAYYAENEGVATDSIQSYRGSLNTALTEASVEVRKGTRGYVDAYSASGNADIYSDRSSNTSTVNVTAVGGDYYFIHPMRLLYGSYISDDDLMKDRVVVDEGTAWFLYGSSNIVGKSLMIGNDRFYIAGVVQAPDSKTSEKTYGSRNRIYMSYDAFSKINKDAKITCYEIIYPDMITNFAYKTLRKTLGLSDDGTDVTESGVTDDNNIDVVNMNTRFRISNIWSVLCSYGERSSHTDGIIYPFWENECRRIEDMLVLELILRIVCIVCIIVCVIPYLVMCFRFCRSKVKNIINVVSSKVRH